VIALVVGGLVSLTAPVIGIIILGTLGLTLARRVRFRTKLFRRIALGVWGAVVGLWLITLALDNTTLNTNLGLPTLALTGMWGLALVDIVLQYLGLRHGETPNQTS
jgi:hypothetical protein